MPQAIRLPFGHSPYLLTVGAPAGLSIRPTVVLPPVPPPARPLEDLLREALDVPIGADRLESAVPHGAKVVVIVSDTTREEPRATMLRAVLERLPDALDLTIAIANGTHGPCDPGRLGIPDDLWARASAMVNHDAYNDSDMVHLGTTRRGTPVRAHRCLAEADWVIATGRIKPHYFAGYGAGCKAIFPGLGANEEVRINHRLKTDPGARPGVLDGNPCREDLEEAASMVPGCRFLVNVVLDSSGNAQAAVAGDVVEAFRAGARACDALYRVSAPRSSLVIVSDDLPLTGSLYQASKLVAAAAGLLLDGGTMMVVAECPEGIGPVETVNRAIYEIGLAPRLPPRHRIVLVSGLTKEQVAASYCEWAPSLEAALTGWENARATIIPYAGSLIIDEQNS